MSNEKQLLSIDGVFNLPKDKAIKKKVKGCNICKCKTLMDEEILHGTSIYICKRPEHEDKASLWGEQRKVQNSLDEIKKGL